MIGCEPHYFAEFMVCGLLFLKLWAYELEGSHETIVEVFKADMYK